MALQNSPYFGIRWGWPLGADGWNNGMDENLLVLSFLSLHAVGSFIDTLPDFPQHGDSYVLDSDGKVYFRINDSWVFIEIPEGYEFTLLSDSTRWVRRDGSYVQIPTVENLANGLDDTGSDLSGITSRITEAESVVSSLVTGLGSIGQDASGLPVTSTDYTKTLTEWMEYLSDRANHVSTQTADTISDFAEAVENSAYQALDSNFSLEFSQDNISNKIYADIIQDVSVQKEVVGGILDLSRVTAGTVVVEVAEDITEIILPEGTTGYNRKLTLILEQDDVGGHTVTGWPNIWLGLEPTLPTDPDSIIRVDLINPNTYGWIGEGYTFEPSGSSASAVLVHEEATNPHPQYAPLVKHEKAGTVAPTVTDDESAGYEVFSVWKNLTDNSVFLCLDATAGAAIWKQITFVNVE